jgi:hypothetical protein
MISQGQFVVEVVRVARERGYKIESNARTGQTQIDFGIKKLHTGHLSRLYPEILNASASISTLIEAVAPGRPCSHKPLREIVEQLRGEGKL